MHPELNDMRDLDREEINHSSMETKTMKIKWIIALTTFAMFALMQVAYPAEYVKRLPQCTLNLPQTTLSVRAYCECPETGVCPCDAGFCVCVGCPIHGASVKYPANVWTYDPLAGGYWMPATGGYWYFRANQNAAGYPRAANPFNLRSGGGFDGGNCSGGR